MDHYYNGQMISKSLGRVSFSSTFFAAGPSFSFLLTKMMIRFLTNFLIKLNSLSFFLSNFLFGFFLYLLQLLEFPSQMLSKLMKRY